jgi:hypothetical protein
MYVRWRTRAGNEGGQRDVPCAQHPIWALVERQPADAVAAVGSSGPARPSASRASPRATNDARSPILRCGAPEYLSTPGAAATVATERYRTDAASTSAQAHTAMSRPASVLRPRYRVAAIAKPPLGVARACSPFSGPLRYATARRTQQHRLRTNVIGVSRPGP